MSTTPQDEKPVGQLDEFFNSVAGVSFAFPLMVTDPGTGAIAIEPGMELRDYFAAQALGSLTITYHFGPNGTSSRPVAADVAAYVYQLADAMIAARNGGARAVE